MRRCSFLPPPLFPGPNPSVDAEKARFDLSQGRLPKRASALGFVQFRVDGACGGARLALFVDRRSCLALPVPAALLEAAASPARRLNAWTIALDVRVAALPPAQLALIRTARPMDPADALEVAVMPDGAVCCTGVSRRKERGREGGGEGTCQCWISPL